MKTFLIFAVSGVFVLTLLNPFWVLPVFIFGHFFQPVQFFPALREYNPSIMIGSAVLVAWIMNMMVTGNITPARNKQVALVILFIMQIFISSALGPLSGFSHVSYLMASIIPFFILVYMVQTRKQLIVIIFVLLLMGTIAALYGIYCVKANIGIRDRGMVRIVSFMSNPNAFGHTMVILIPIALSLMLVPFYTAYRLGLCFLAALFVLAAMTSGSRNVFFPMVFFLLFTPAIYHRGNKKIMAFVLTILMLPIGYFALPDSVKWRYTNRITNLFEAESLEEIDEGRVETAKAGWKMMFKHPLLGVGIGGFGYEYARIAQYSEDIDLVKSRYGDRGLNAHNAYVEVGGQLGILGLLIYLSIVITAYRDAKRSEMIFYQAGDDTLRSIAVSLRICIIGSMMIGMFNRLLHDNMFWIIIALTVVLNRLAVEQIGLLNTQTGEPAVEQNSSLMQRVEK